MMKVTAIVHKREWDITQIIQKMTWSGALSQCMRTLSISYKLRDDMPIRYFPSGTIIKFVIKFMNEKTLFEGRLFKPSKNLRSSGGTMVAYDDSVFMSKSSISLKYRNASVNDIADEVCKRYGLTVIKNRKLVSRQSDIVFNKTGNAVISEILQGEYEQTEKAFFTRTLGKNISILEEGEIMAKYPLSPSQNLTDVVLSEDALAVVNAVEIVNSEGEVVDCITDDESIAKLGGRLTKGLKYSPDWEQKSKAMLKPVKYSYNFKGLTDNADVSFIAGNKVKVESVSGDEYFIIESDSHTFDGVKHSMDLKMKIVEEAS